MYQCATRNFTDRELEGGAGKRLVVWMFWRSMGNISACSVVLAVYSPVQEVHVHTEVLLEKCNQYERV